MQLDSFITETLISIIKGVKNAEEFAKINGARINPVRYNAPDQEYVYFGNDEGKKPYSIIHFDVAVTAAKSDEGNATGGIKVFAIELGAKTSSKNDNETVSRISFQIGAVLPYSEGGIAEKQWNTAVG